MKCNLVVCDRCEAVIKDSRIMIRITQGGNATIAKFDLCKKCQNDVFRVLYKDEEEECQQTEEE